MKGYYITYGIFTSEIEEVVKDLESELQINLLSDGYEEDEEIYYLDKSKKHYIDHFSIYYGSLIGYHLDKLNVLYPKYLISCNLTSDQYNKEEYVKTLRKVLNEKEYLKELNFDTDEW